MSAFFFVVLSCGGRGHATCSPRPRSPTKYDSVRFQVFTEVKMSIMVFWVVTLCGLVGGYQRFGEKYRLFLQDRFLL